MKVAMMALALMSLSAPMLLATPPAPPVLHTDFGCQRVILHWPLADSAWYHPDGYQVFRRFQSDGIWERRGPSLIEDTLLVDSDIVLSDSFTYGVAGVYGDSLSPIREGRMFFLPNPESYDYLLVGDTATAALNDWYIGMLESFGLHGARIVDLLPYCGDILANLRLLWVVRLGSFYPFWENTERDFAVVDYLNYGGRIYADEGWSMFSDTTSHYYLFYEYTTCISYPFLSIHGMPNTFTEGLWFRFPDTLYSSNLILTGPPDVVETVLEDDVECGCVDLVVHRDGYKVVVNSQPLQAIIDNDTTGTRRDYFRRMLQYFDILSDVDDQAHAPSPQSLSLTAFPNPFNSRVLLAISAAPSGDAAIDIFDISGRKVKSIPVSHGAGSIAWDGRAGDGATASSGVYFARLNHGGLSATTKLTLVK